MVKITEKKVIFALLVLLSFLFQCAKEGMPPGGPEDTIPPEVISVLPEPNSTKVDPDSRIEITFTERMTAKITEESIFISPLPPKPFSFRWKGRRFILTPQEPLQPDRTYVVSIGTDAQDLRRNRLSQSYTFAFSTGSQLDHGTISGEVWKKGESGLGKEMGISIWAYLLSPDMTEIDPEEEKPDYVTQTDNEGRYVLENLSMGRYRLFAVQDADRGLIWDWEKEAIGVTTGDVDLGEQDTSKAHVDFVLDRRDRSQPGLLNCLSPNRNSIRLEFDEELDEESLSDPANFRILSASTQKPVEVTTAFSGDADTRIVLLVTGQMNPGEKYELKVLHAKDRAENYLDTTLNTCLFDGTEIPDTAGPVIVGNSPKDGEVDLPLDARMRLAFNEPPQQQPVQTAFSLVDSNQVDIRGKGEWSAPNLFVFSPDSALSGSMKYEINLSGKRVLDLFGNGSMTDSVFTSSFTTLDPDDLGVVSGSARLANEDESKALVLTLWPLAETKSPYQVTLSQPGPFLFEEVQPGRYFLGGYVDLDEDGVLSLGQPEPFSPAEPFVMYPDTIVVRSRWETEGIQLIFP